MPRTLRELVWAYHGKEYAEWERTAQLWAVFAEANRNPKQRSTPFSASDLFQRPGTKRARGVALTGQAFRAMRSIFVKKRQ